MTPCGTKEGSAASSNFKKLETPWYTPWGMSVGSVNWFWIDVTWSLVIHLQKTLLFCLRWCFTFYQGKSPLNHHLGDILFLSKSPTTLSKPKKVLVFMCRKQHQHWIKLISESSNSTWGMCILSIYHPSPLTRILLIPFLHTFIIKASRTGICIYPAIVSSTAAA